MGRFLSLLLFLVPLRSQGRKSGSVEFHADHPNQSFQGTSVSGRGDHGLRPLVPVLMALRATKADENALYEVLHPASIQ